MGLALGDRALAEILRNAGGDARRALNTLEVAAELAANTGCRSVTPADVTEAVQHKALLYDRAGEEHYNGERWIRIPGTSD
jgi:putative ATPase